MSKEKQPDYIKVLIHEHREGQTLWPFRAKNIPNGAYDVAGIARALAVNYEPWKDEFLSVESLDLNAIPELDLASLPPAEDDEAEEEER